ncbi:MAG: hypothetical protein OK457_03865 [Thaumarchaeota archaeon]|nr:hypothetical protein [Nitrososphaerota archaeon]
MSSEVQMAELSSKQQELRVVVSLGDARAEFSGTPEIVLQSVNNFVSKNVPEINLARKLSMSFSTKDLVEKFRDFVRITPEGPRVWTQDGKLSDKEQIGLQLVAQRIASETASNVPQSLTLNSLQEITSLNPKSLSSRLSEMTKSGFVQKDSVDEKSQFRITTIGIDWLSTLLSKKNKQ